MSSSEVVWVYRNTDHVFKTWFSYITYVSSLLLMLLIVSHPGGHWPRKGVWGCAALKTPFSRLSCRSQGSHFKQKSQFTRLSFWENLEILACTASIFTQILAHKPPNLKIFSSQAPKFGNFQLTSPKFGNFPLISHPFLKQMSVRKPHTSEIRAAHPYLKKKNWVPPPDHIRCS